MEIHSLIYITVSPYREVLEGMELALQINDGIIKLTGRDGAGKTALCRELGRLLEAKGLRVLYFPVAPDNVDELHAEILAQLGLGSSPNFTKQLSRYLQEQPAGMQQLHVIFDEAQDISEPVFDSIRMLCNIQDSRQALIKPIICGSPVLEAKLAHINFRSVAQYLSQSFTLAPMTIEQIKDFYQAYWRQRGIDLRPSTSTLVNNLFNVSQGFPSPILAKLELDYEPAVDRREGRGSEDEPGMLEPPVTGIAAETWLGLGFGTMVLAAAAGMYYVSTKVDAKTPLVRAAPVAAPSVPVEVAAEVVPVNSVLLRESEPALPEEKEPAEPGGLATASSLDAADALLRSWSDSWMQQDIDAYLGYYAADFVPANGATLESWQEQRRSSISRASGISIDIESLKLLSSDEDSMTLQFWLHYSASNYADDTLKEVVLTKTAEGLRILSELNLLIERPQ